MKKKSSKKHENRSLSEVHESVVVPSRGPWWRRWLAITGPALMAAVGFTWTPATGQQTSPGAAVITML
ncbi:MAG: hypothetical protein WBL25_17780 [Anaerolineales bacterium]